MSKQLAIEFNRALTKQIEFTNYKSGTLEFLTCKVLGFYCYIDVKESNYPNALRFQTNARKGFKPYPAKQFATMEEAQLEFCKILNSELTSELGIDINFVLKQQS